MLELLRKASQREKYEAVHKAADKMRPRIRKAFLRAIEELKSKAVLKRIEEAIKANRIDEAIAFVDQLEDLLIGAGLPAGESSFRDEIRTAFAEGAGVGINQLPQRAITSFAFDLFNPRAVEWAEENSARLIEEVTDTTRRGVRDLIVRSVDVGITPRNTARNVRDLAGLTTQQMRAVVNFREQLETQSNAGLNPAWMRRLSASEKAVVRRHMKEGHLTKERIDSLVDRYHKSLINKRSLDIARTESINSVQAGQLEAWRQAQAQGLLPDDVKRKWIVTPDDRLRHTHAAIPGMNEGGVGLFEDFETPFGPVEGPHDNNENLINCRCSTVLTNLD